MREVTKKGLITFAAAGGVLALGGGYAHADSGAEGSASHSPGVLSGNSVQAPVHIPVNACGNTVDVIGVLNPAMGNACANKSGPAKQAKPGKPGSATPGKPGPANPGSHTGGGATAEGDTSHSPGVGSGNNIKVPIHLPVNACGNGVSVIGLLNPVMGNDCTNQSGPSTPTKPENPGNPGTPTTPVQPPAPHTPGTPGTPPTRAVPNVPQPQTVSQPEATESLAQTGASGSLGTVIPAGAGLLLAGALLYRRSRSAA
ncbi:chaplin [Streptomyces sp. NPDC058657]|uniref:chaplin n=1 Tax=unclassified Streptomyces TaxID=2593676 RepID=UPI0036642D2C